MDDVAAPARAGEIKSHLSARQLRDHAELKTAPNFTEDVTWLDFFGPCEVVVFAALFESNIDEVTFTQQPRPDKEAPDFLNWSRLVTPARLLTLVKNRCMVTVESPR